jgi:hypothetical protein
MRRWGLVIAVVVSVALAAPFMTGCESDGDEGNGGGSTESGPVGTWSLASATITSDELPGGGLTLTVSQMAALGGEVAATTTFHADGTVTGTMRNEDGTTEAFAGTWSVSGNQLTIAEGGTSETMTYGISGNTLTLSFTDSMEGTVVTVSLNFDRQ